MSLRSSPRPKRPNRPPSFDSSTVHQTPMHPAIAQANPFLPPQDTPVYLPVLPEELPHKLLVTPARPAPPVPRRSSPYWEDHHSQITQPEKINGYEDPATVRNAGDFQHSLSSDGTWSTCLYEDVLPDETDLTDCTTAQNYPPPRPFAPPRPAAPPCPAVVRPQRPFLSKCILEDPTEHLYEYIPDLLTDDQQQDEGGMFSSSDLPAVPVKRRPQNCRSWSEQCSMEGNNKELDLLLDWWRSVEEWDHLAMQYRGEELKLLLSVAHRVKMAMRLFELLMFEHGWVLLNYITELHCTADSVAKSSKTTRIMGMTGGTTGAVGAVAVIAGLALAPLTFGASVVAAGVGVGVAAAGGVTGASAAITNKVKNSQFRHKVERILKNYKYHMEDIMGCLMFIDVGMDLLRRWDHSKLKYVNADDMKIVQMAQETEGLASTDAVGESAGVLQAFASGLDSYFSEEDQYRLKKDSESQFAREVREVAHRLKEGMDELIRIKNLFRSVVCKSL